MITSLLVLSTAFMVLFPETPASRLLHRYLAEKPVDFLARIERRHVIFAIVGVGALLFARQALTVLGSADLAVLAMWDMALYADAAIAVWTLSAVTRARATWSVVTSRVLCIVFRPKSRAVLRRQSRTRSDSAWCTPANDDDDHPRYHLAA